MFLRPIHDGLTEAAETVALTVTTGADDCIGTPTFATGTITDGTGMSANLVSKLDDTFRLGLEDLLP